MNLKRLTETELTLLFSALLAITAFLMITTPAAGNISRTLLIICLTLFLLSRNKREPSKTIKLIFQTYVMLMILTNKIKTTGDIIIGKEVYIIPQISVTNATLGIITGALLMLTGVYLFLYHEINLKYKNQQKYKKDTKIEKGKMVRDIFLILIICLIISESAIAFVRPIADFYINRKVDLLVLQNNLFLGLIDGTLILAPTILFFITLIQDLKPVTYNNFLINENKTIIKYKGKNKQIIIPKELNIYCTDTFCECDSTYEISFEEGTIEVPPLKFNKSIPQIHYPDSLLNIREYSLFMKDGNPFDNSATVEMLLKNPTFKIIDGSMVNTRTNTLLFVINHKTEYKISDNVKQIGRYAFDDLMLGKGYKLKKDSKANLQSWHELMEEYQNFSNGTDKEYLFYEVDTVCSRPQLEKLYLHKNIERIDKDALELATGIREVYVPEEAEYDLAEMIKTRSYIKYLGKGKKITHRMIERLLQIHAKIKSGCYPNSKQLAYDLETSEPTINRDIEYLRDTRGAPIEYDYVKRGYFYSEDYDLFFDN